MPLSANIDFDNPALPALTIRDLLSIEEEAMPVDGTGWLMLQREYILAYSYGISQETYVQQYGKDLSAARRSEPALDKLLAMPSTTVVQEGDGQDGGDAVSFDGLRISLRPFTVRDRVAMQRLFYSQGPYHWMIQSFIDRAGKRDNGRNRVESGYLESLPAGNMSAIILVSQRFLGQAIQPMPGQPESREMRQFREIFEGQS